MTHRVRAAIVEELTIVHISAYNRFMRRKKGQLIPIELSILNVALRLRSRGEDEFHGFRIAKEMKEIKKARLLTAHGTLYRALKRLEKMGLLSSRWEDPAIAEKDNRPRRKFYTLTADGVTASVRSQQELESDDSMCWSIS